MFFVNGNFKTQSGLKEVHVLFHFVVSIRDPITF